MFIRPCTTIRKGRVSFECNRISKIFTVVLEVFFTFRRNVGWFGEIRMGPESTLFSPNSVISIRRRKNALILLIN